MGQTSVPDQSESTYDELIALAGNDDHNVVAGDPADHGHRLGQHDTYPQPALGWQGPLAFASAHGTVPGIDHDSGMRWGPNRDQRVSIRVEAGANAGLLYAYDPAWDEYAVIGMGVELAAVQDAFACAVKLGEPLAVEDFVALLPTQPAVHWSLGREL
jgi:hypothetical protein